MIVVMTYLWRVKLKYISPSVSITQRPQFRYNKSVVVAINIISPYLIDWVVQFWWLGLEDMNFSLHLLFPQHNLWNTKLVRSANTAAWTGLEQGALFGEALVTERNGENIGNEFTSQYGTCNLIQQLLKQCATGISVMIPLSQGMNRDATISGNMYSSNVQTTPPSFWKSAVMNITHEIGVL
jgi:hypothetical protein